MSLPSGYRGRIAYSSVALAREQDFLARVAGRGVQREALDVVSRTVVSGRVHLLPSPGRPLGAVAKSPRAVDGFAIVFQPLAEIGQPILHEHGNAPIGRGTDIEQQVAAAAHRVDERQQQPRSAGVVRQVFIAVETIGVAQAAILLPGVGRTRQTRAVFGGVVTAVPMARLAAPSIVDHHALRDCAVVEQPGQQLGRAPLLGRQVPFTIGKNDGRRVTRDEVLELRKQVAFDVGIRRRRQASAG